MVDPVTAGLGIAGGLLGKLFAPSTPSPSAPPPAAGPIQSPQGNASTAKQNSGVPSFLGAAAAPNQQNTATKSLLGQ